jgi:hypothetical protein
MVQEVEGRTVLLDIDSGEYFALNGVGRSVWDLCDGTRTVAEVVAAICGEYDVSAETASDDTGALIESLAEAGLVVGS